MMVDPGTAKHTNWYRDAAIRDAEMRNEQFRGAFAAWLRGDDAPPPMGSLAGATYTQCQLILPTKSISSDALDWIKEECAQYPDSLTIDASDDAIEITRPSLIKVMNGIGITPMLRRLQRSPVLPAAAATGQLTTVGAAKVLQRDIAAVQSMLAEMTKASQCTLDRLGELQQRMESIAASAELMRKCYPRARDTLWWTLCGSAIGTLTAAGLWAFLAPAQG